jgi:microcystin-dependent protein
MAEVGLVPIGSILPFAGEKIDDRDHWRLCDGASLNKGDFGALFDVIGTKWGGDGANLFSLPDLRGRFLRGRDGESRRDPDATGRTAPRPDLHDQGNTGDAVGSVQNDAMQGHTHTWTWDRGHSNVAGSNGSHDADGGDQKYNCDPPSGGVGGSNSGAVNDGHGEPRVSSETRPANAAANFIIRVA